MKAVYCFGPPSCTYLLICLFCFVLQRCIASLLQKADKLYIPIILQVYNYSSFATCLNKSVQIMYHIVYNRIIVLFPNCLIQNEIEQTYKFLLFIIRNSKRKSCTFSRSVCHHNNNGCVHTIIIFCLKFLILLVDTKKKIKNKIKILIIVYTIIRAIFILSSAGNKN